MSSSLLVYVNVYVNVYVYVFLFITLVDRSLSLSLGVVASLVSRAWFAENAVGGLEC